MPRIVVQTDLTRDGLLIPGCRTLEIHHRRRISRFISEIRDHLEDQGSYTFRYCPRRHQFDFVQGPEIPDICRVCKSNPDFPACLSRLQFANAPVPDIQVTKSC